ncbi:MAG: uroporphyrinogen-III synthase [Opitutales bacterium]|nr:uroporphyrinogen-III synthase [Opitutales bacterium]
MSTKKNQPLEGRKIVVTRAADQSGSLVELLAAEGAEVIELPLIQTRCTGPTLDTQEAFKELWTYEWLIFTSPNGVRYFFELFFKTFDDIRSLGGAHIAAVGNGTAEALRKFYIKAELIPEVQTSEGLAEALTREQTLDNLNILIVTGNQASEELSASLEAALAIVDKVQFYSTERNDISKHPSAARFRSEGADAIVFASGSAVESFVAQAKDLKTEANARRPQACSIGPVTTEIMKKYGIPVDISAAKPTPSDIVKALCKHFAK